MSLLMCLGRPFFDRSKDIACDMFRFPILHAGPHTRYIWLFPLTELPNPAGLMGTFASSAAGSVAGNMIANTMFGGRSEAAPAAPAQVT